MFKSRFQRTTRCLAITRNGRRAGRIDRGRPALRNQVRSHRDLDSEQRARFDAPPRHQERARRAHVTRPSEWYRVLLVDPAKPTRAFEL